LQVFLKDYLGGIVGVLVSSFFSDNFGRKNTVAILWFISSIFLLQMAFVNSYSYLLITLFMSAFGVMGSSNLHFVILNEQAGEMFRFFIN
jgi:MFS family permease